MNIDENTRLDLRQAFEELIGPELANAAMEAMPPLDYNQFATKADVTNLGITLRGDIADVRTELAEVRTEMAGLRGEMHTEVGSLRSSIELQLAKNLRATVLTQVATMAAFAGIIAGVS